MSLPIELFTGLLAGIGTGVSVGALLSLVRKRLDSVRLKRKLSVKGRSIDIDTNRLEELKHFVLSIMDEPQVFIAYSFKDSSHAKKLAQDLRSKGLRVWLAEEQIRPGDNIQKKINEALQTSGYLLALLSRASLSSEGVKNEFQMALLRESQGKWPRVIPVLIEPIDIPVDIRGKLYVDLTGDYDSGVQKIVSGITDAHVMASIENETANKSIEVDK